MKIVSTSDDFNSVAPLIADYAGWLRFLATSRRTLHYYEYRLTHLARIHPDLGGYSEFLRDCLHRRSEFLGALAVQLRSKVAQLRRDPTPVLIRQLTDARPTMRVFLGELAEGFAVIQAFYSTLIPFLPPPYGPVRGSTCIDRDCLIDLTNYRRPGSPPFGEIVKLESNPLPFRLPLSFN